MPDVIDFLVLRQSYDEALRRNWQPSKCSVNVVGVKLNPVHRNVGLNSEKLTIESCVWLLLKTNKTRFFRSVSDLKYKDLKNLYAL